MPSNSAAANGSAPRGMSRFFSDRRINTKIGLGFATVLLITAVISVMAFAALVRISGGFTEYSHLAAVVANARDLDRGFLAFRRYAIEFSLSGDEEAATNAQKARGALKDLLAKGSALVKNPE